MLFYNYSVFMYSTVAGRKCEINIILSLSLSLCWDRGALWLPVKAASHKCTFTYLLKNDDRERLSCPFSTSDRLYGIWNNVMCCHV